MNINKSFNFFHKVLDEVLINAGHHPWSCLGHRPILHQPGQHRYGIRFQCLKCIARPFNSHFSLHFGPTGKIHFNLIVLQVLSHAINPSFSSSPLPPPPSKYLYRNTSSNKFLA